MKLLYLREHLCCSNYQMNSDTGFSCHQLDKDDVYQIDNSKSSCALFVIQGRVNFDLGKSYEGEMEQRQMLYIPQNMKAQIESITSSRCILLFWDKHLNVCNKLFLNSLLSKENDTDIKNIILPIKSPLIKSRKTKSDGREKRKAIFEAKTKCAQKSRLLPPSGQNTSVVQTPFESCLKDAFLLNFLLKYHLKTHCQFSKKSYLYIVVMLPLCIPSRPHS